jgi:two-component system, OmpR family, sensor histidine kinase TctE
VTDRSVQANLPFSLYKRLLIGLLLPISLLLALVSFFNYKQTLESATIAYDRTLLASAKSIGELLTTSGEGANLRLTANVLYAALEPFESDNRSRMFYKVIGFNGETVSGYADFPNWKGTLPAKNIYPALIDFYDDVYQSEPVRVAVLLQPVASSEGNGMATVIVAETLELRKKLAKKLLVDTLILYGISLLAIGLIVTWIVRWTTKPIRQLEANLSDRNMQDLRAIDTASTPIELMPIVNATNQLIDRLRLTVEHQRKFVRDAAHQLRTPLAVLKTQVQSALRNDVAPMQALSEIEATVDRATGLANQMLDLAKVEQLRQETNYSSHDWDAILRSVTLDLAPLIASKNLLFGLESTSVNLDAHAWMLQELTRNLLHNAITHAPHDSALTIRLTELERSIELTIEDQGPGIEAPLSKRLFQTFSAGQHSRGAGLGLAICQEITKALNGALSLENLYGHANEVNQTSQSGSPGRVVGLIARAQIPKKQPTRLR